MEKVTALISLGSPKSNRNKWWGLDKHTLEMPGKQSRKLKESTLIKMLTETLSIYERGLTLRKKRSDIQLELKNHLSSAFQVHTVSQAHSLHICTQPPTHGSSPTVSFFFMNFAQVIFKKNIVLSYNSINPTTKQKKGKEMKSFPSFNSNLKVKKGKELSAQHLL